MRITNKIMQNNSLYNINNNKVAEDKLNTMMSTGKKITRPSDDPVIAIRALRLRSNVTQLSQYYEKNAKDAESWLQVTADALSTVTAVLTDSVKQATKGANKDLTLDDMSIIVTQMDALAKEYYSTGNVDFAGRYVFTGYRTNDPLSFDKTTTAVYEDINDEFNAGNIDDSSRVVGKYQIDDASHNTKESDIIEKTVGRIRLSYDNLDYQDGDGKTATLKFREDMTQPATSTINNKEQTISLTFKNTQGKTFYAELPISKTGDSRTITSDGVTYKATQNADGSYYIQGQDSNTGEVYKINVTAEGIYDPTGSTVGSAITAFEERAMTTITYTSGTTVKSVDVPLLPAIDQTYDLNIEDAGYVVTVNSDGTYTLKNTPAGSVNEVVQITSNGSVKSSYMETSIEIDEDHIIYSTTSEEDIDAAYNNLTNETVTLGFTSAAGYSESITISPDGSISKKGYPSSVSFWSTKDTDGNYVINGTETVTDAWGNPQVKQYQFKVAPDGTLMSSQGAYDATSKLDNMLYLNASTGEVLLCNTLKDKLAALPDIINANTIDVIYDKKEWVNGDIKPEHLFGCEYTNESGKKILYNQGTADHTIAYDVGFAQAVVVNTTADEVFTTDIKRDVSDLSNMLSELKQIDTTIKNLKDKLEVTQDSGEQEKIQNKIDAATKAYDYLRENMQKEFEHKITSMQKNLDRANIAVTDNGTRAKRLDLINSRLMTQTTTFKTLQSENEDVDLAEAATRLTTAQVTYEASLMATGKISQTSLLNYL